LRSGIEVVLDAVRFDDRIGGADLIITGEGRIDVQTLYGKAIMGVLCRAAGRVPVVAIGGCVAEGAEALYDEGLAGIFGITDQPMSQEDAMRRAPELISKAARGIVTLFGWGKNADERR
jgi:glycerate 2-kinase